jgi:xanthine dehydrogenase accessory factor
MNDAEDVLEVAAAWRRDGERVALATVTQTWGSSPRPAGSRMAVAEAARETIATGVPQLLDFGVTDERAWEVGLACGGKLKVFVEAFA